MTDKITLATLANLQNDTTATSAINSNSALITSAFDNTLSRDGTSPNQMESTLDMNSNRIINLPLPVSGTEPFRLQDFQNQTVLITQVGTLTAGSTGPGFTINLGQSTLTGQVPIVNGGTGASTASQAITNLGLGTMATENANAVAITGGTITGLPTPVLASDAVNKAYADTIASGIRVQTAVRLATAAVLPNTPTYSNGTAGVGATLTASSNTTLTVDGTTANLNDRILVINQATPANNGVYSVTTAGSGSAAWVLTRVTDFDTPAQMVAGSYFVVTAGSANVNTSWVLSATTTTVGTTAVLFNLYTTPAGVSSLGGATGAVTLDSNLSVVSNVLTANVRPRLTAAKTYYVRSDGSDSNTGLSDGSGTSFLTWQHAVNVAATWDFNGFTITLQHGVESASKTFTVSVTVPTLVGGGQLSILGSPTAGGTIFNVTGADCFELRDTKTSVLFDQMTLIGGASGLINIVYASTAIFGGNMIFSTANFAQIYVHDSNSQAYLLNGNYTIAGSPNSCHILINGGMVFLESCNVSLTGSPNFPGSFVVATNGGKMQTTNCTFTGFTTGPRYSVTGNSVVDTFGGGANYFPGNTVGSTASGGQYLP